jgi:hypothetical protein
MCRRLTFLALALVALAVAAMPAAAAKKADGPTVRGFSPAKPELGGKLTLVGKGFAKKRSRNTVVLRAPNGGSTFLKPVSARKRRIVVRLRNTIERLMAEKAGVAVATRFRVRILAGKSFGPWTKKKSSPVIQPSGAGGGGGGVGTDADCDADGSPNGSDSDDDNDLLADTLETKIKTDVCIADTDVDGLSDGWEQQSAVDLGHYPRTQPLPYPGKRPYPNALDPSDPNTDYDGDGLTAREEYLLWANFVADGAPRSGPPTTLDNLLYSDGLQKSINPAPAAPEAPLDRWTLDNDGDLLLGDDERDGDGDGLNNWDEQHGQFTETWWAKVHDGQLQPLESKYPEINFLDVADLPNLDALIQSDMDGDGIDDGDDDHDHDGLSNQFEVERPANHGAEWYEMAFADPPTDFSPGPNPWAYTQPFNPCKPFDSERCHKYVPFGYYASDGVPPIGPAPPAGYPDSHPVTPGG